MGRMLGAALLVLLVAPPVRAEEPEDRTRRLLEEVRKDADAKAWRQAVDALRDGTDEERAQLSELLGRMAETRHRDLARSTRRFDALAGQVGDGNRHEPIRLAWETARERASAWLFDEEAFPDPGDRVVTGPMEGYDAAKRRGDEARSAWRGLARQLDRATKPVRTLSAGRARALRDDHEAKRDAFRRVAAELSGDRRPDLVERPVDPLAVQFLHLALGDFASAAEAYAGMGPGWRKLCLFHAYARAATDWNDDHPFGMEKSALAALEDLNAYRIALGISPVVHNAKLVRTAFKHSEEMVKLAYFSHRSPVAARRTKKERAALEGYHERLVECITGAGGGMKAVEFWKYDGGHHRDMIDPRTVEGGFSTRGPSVYVGGSGEKDCIPGIRY